MRVNGNAVDLITRSSISDVIRAASRRYKHVVVDTAPQLVTGEAAIIV